MAAAGRGGTGGGAAGRGGSAGGASGGNSGGGASGYNPCPTNGDPCRILPVGDSITFGINQEGSYRIELFHKAVQATQKITYTGTLQNGPQTVDSMPFPRRYEATSGITINGISTQITNNKTLNMPSDIIIVHIGTNDMYMNTSTASPADAPANLGKLLDKLIAGMPNALIVVAKIIPLSTRRVGGHHVQQRHPGRRPDARRGGRAHHHRRPEHRVPGGRTSAATTSTPTRRATPGWATSSTTRSAPCSRSDRSGP